MAVLGASRRSLTLVQRLVPVLTRPEPPARREVAVCLQCRIARHYSQQTPLQRKNAPPWLPNASLLYQRRNVSTSQPTKEQQKPHPPTSFEKPTEDAVHSPTAESVPAQASTEAHPPTPQQQFTSHLNTLTTNLLTTATSLSQRLNIYTGTDYTPIADLRSSITSQESAIKAAHAAVAHAKAAHASAQTTQSGAQKEVVQLLERKHSWTNPDLERYMALIRSEHVNEQGVAAASSEVAAAERALEHQRQALEKMERRMYHEEQLWSDNIRRNSTWVTAGLMGLNLLLLLVNVVLVEPWRRRRMVREIKDGMGAAAAPAGGPAGDVGLPSREQLAAAGDVQGSTAALSASAPEADAAADLDVPRHVNAASTTGLATDESTSSRDTLWLDPSAWSSALSRRAADLLSDRVLSLRMIDATTLAAESAAAGAASTLIILWAAGAFAKP